MVQVKEFINNICLAHVIGYLCKNLSYYSHKCFFFPPPPLEKNNL